MSPRQASRRAALRTLFAAFPGRTSALAGLAVLVGILPAAFAAFIGVLVSQLPGLTRAGFSSAAGHRAVAALIAIAATLVMIELADSAREVISTDLYRRFDGHLLGPTSSSSWTTGGSPSRAAMSSSSQTTAAMRSFSSCRLGATGRKQPITGCTARWRTGLLQCEIRVALIGRGSSH
jgi:hypothetical protein